MYSEDPIKNDLISAEFKRLNESILALQRENEIQKMVIMVCVQKAFDGINDINDRVSELYQRLTKIDGIEK